MDHFRLAKFDSFILTLKKLRKKYDDDAKEYVINGKLRIHVGPMASTILVNGNPLITVSTVGPVRLTRALSSGGTLGVLKSTARLRTHDKSVNGRFLQDLHSQLIAALPAIEQEIKTRSKRKWS